jgi:molybdenum cofactor biosynthesis protein B
VSASSHRKVAPAAGEIRVAVITVSDTRTLQTDESGSLAEALTTKAGFRVTRRELVRDEPAQIAARVQELCGKQEVDAVLLTGGTGVAARDGTVEAVTPLLDRHLDGFGELFRMLSFAEVGPAAMLSRAVGGTLGRVAIFAMPGSPAAVQLALGRLVLPELCHLVGQLRHASAIHQQAGGPSAAESGPEHVHGTRG